MIGKLTVIAVGAVLASVGAAAAPADHYTADDLAKAADALKAKNAVSDTLATYPNHHTMVAYRSKDGNAELHAKEADVFVIVRGKATLLTEGVLEGGKETGPGEIRGTKVSGGKSMALKPGDIVHIPAGTPHQLLIASGDELVYFIVKIEEH
jgi:mannose-6-phosphate isomerase-like protein (cupin superfamily)